MAKITDKELGELELVMWEYMRAFYDRETDTIVHEINHEDEFNDWWYTTGEEGKEESEKRYQEFINNPTRYVEIERPYGSHDAYRVMERFVVQLPQGKERSKLFSAIKGSKPFRRFKNVIDWSPYRQDWFAWKNKAQLREWRRMVERALGEEE